VHPEVAGAAHECVDTMYAKSLAADIAQLGLNKGLACLNSVAHRPGTIDLTYAAPDFGGGGSGTTDYETVSTGGEGGNCSTSTTLTASSTPTARRGRHARRPAAPSALSDRAPTVAVSSPLTWGHGATTLGP